jgi:hypothetical protein
LQRFMPWKRPTGRAMMASGKIRKLKQMRNARV